MKSNHYVLIYRYFTLIHRAAGWVKKVHLGDQHLDFVA